MRSNRRAIGTLGGLAFASTIAASVSLVGLSCSKNPDAGPSAESIPPGTTASGAPSFELPKDPVGAMRAANLHDIPIENAKVLFRSHVDVVVNDKAVTIPSMLGINKTASSPVTTADNSGVVQINGDRTVEEPPDKKKDKTTTFRVGQLFAEWDVKLDKACLATWCNDDKNQLLGFVNGQLVADPASIPFRPNDQIVVWYGPKGSNPKVPSTYTFGG